MSFIIGKLLWIVFAPGNLLLLLLLLGLALGYARKGRGRVLVVAAALGFLACAALPLGAWVAAPLENRFPEQPVLPDRIDGVVLLGGAVDPVLSHRRGQVALNDAAERVTATVALARRYPKARILVSGGEGSLVQHGLPEAAATRDLMIALGVAPERIVLETRSRDTAENAVMSYALARPEPGETWLLVTSAMHMPRAVGSFRRAGWRILPFPVDYRTAPHIRLAPAFALAEDLPLLTAALKEWVGLVAYYAMGRTDALFPGPAAG